MIRPNRVGPARWVARRQLGLGRVNADKIRLTGQKLDQKIYYRHTGYPGGLRETPVRKMLETRPDRVIEEAVLGMLPKNKLRNQFARRLRVYAGSEHPHEALNPEIVEA